MPESDYTNRELDVKFTQIMDLLREIRDQTTRTNGRVTKLEFWREGITGRLIGGLAIITLGIEIVSKVFFK